MMTCNYCASEDIVVANSFELTCTSCGTVVQEYFTNEQYVTYHYDQRLVPILKSLIDECDLCCDGEDEFSDLCIIAHYCEEENLKKKCIYAISQAYKIYIIELCEFLSVKNTFSIPVTIDETIVKLSKMYDLSHTDVIKVKDHYRLFHANKEIYCSQYELVRSMLKYIFPKLPIVKSKTYKKLYSNTT